MNPLINQELVKIRAYLPVRLATLSKHNESLALELMRCWGEGTKPLREIWDLVNGALDVATSKTS